MTDEQPTMTIERVRVLNGHTSPETAYHADDYPYGRRLRCQIRYWIETAEKGAAKGRMRFMRQTTNPKAGHAWNKPHASTYADLAVLYLDEIDHVQWHAVSLHISPDADARTRLMGIYDQFTDADRRRYDALLKLSQRDDRPWHEWEEKVHALTLHIQETGEDPEIVNGLWEPEGRRIYLWDPAAYVATARQRLSQS